MSYSRQLEYDAYVVDVYEMDNKNKRNSPNCMAHQNGAEVEITGFVSCVRWVSKYDRGSQWVSVRPRSNNQYSNWFGFRSNKQYSNWFGVFGLRQISNILIGLKYQLDNDNSTMIGFE